MKRVILVGAGHAHAQVLRRWADHPLPGVELVMVSPVALAPYSGMVPGWLAGNYAFEEICIDVPALCAASGASFLRDELAALDAPRRRILLKSGVELDYDLLSLNVGSTLALLQTARRRSWRCAQLPCCVSVGKACCSTGGCVLTTRGHLPSQPLAEAPRASNRCSPCWPACAPNAPEALCEGPW